MSRLQWDVAGEKFYETGVDQVVLYPSNGSNGYANGVAWNGVTSITDSPSGAEVTALWADNQKYVNLLSAEEFGGTIEAYQYPDEFNACNGVVQIAKGAYAAQQARIPFGLTYRTKIGNDTNGQDAGYKLHIVYGCTASPSEMNYATVNDNPEAGTMSFEFKGTPVNVPNHKATCVITVDSRDFTSEQDKAKLTALEDLLYGSASGSGNPTLPDPATIISTLGALG